MIGDWFLWVLFGFLALATVVEIGLGDRPQPRPTPGQRVATITISTVMTTMLLLTLL